MTHSSIPPVSPGGNDKTYGMQNTWLLFISICLGVLVVFIYNIHIMQIRKEAEAKMVKIASLAKSIDEGKRIKEGDLESKLITEAVMVASDGRFVKWGDIRQICNDEYRSQRKLNKGMNLRWEDVEVGERSRKTISDRLLKGISDGAILSVKIDKDHCSGQLLQPSDKVKLTVARRKGREVVVQDLIVGVMVVGIDGSRDAHGKRSYDNIEIIVKEQYVNDLMSIQGMLEDGFGLVVLSSVKDDDSEIQYNPFNGLSTRLKKLKTEILGQKVKSR